MAHGDRSARRSAYLKPAPKTQTVSKTQRYALTLLSESVPVGGSLGELYLRHRGPGEANAEALRFHPGIRTGAWVECNEKRIYVELWQQVTP